MLIGGHGQRDQEVKYDRRRTAVFLHARFRRRPRPYLQLGAGL